MATICKCDKCGSESARGVNVVYDNPGVTTNPGETFAFDLCKECADEILAPFRKIKNIIGGRMLAAQVTK